MQYALEAHITHQPPHHPKISPVTAIGFSSLPSCQLVQFTHLAAYIVSNHTPYVSIRVTHLLTNVLATILASHLMLDDRILGEILIDAGQSIQREAHADEVDQPVQEDTFPNQLTIRSSHPSVTERGD